MQALKNVLFIMSDQLRCDYVSAFGPSPVPTPQMERLARRGVRFERAYVQAPVCGPSRMSYYTGRYVASHGARANRTALSVAELTLGDYLMRAGRKAVLAGKSHVLPDLEGLARFGVDGASPLHSWLTEGGFTPIERFDGHSPPDYRSGYADFLKSHVYVSENPWLDYAVSTVDEAGEVHSGWQMRNVHWPARVAEEHSETAFLTDQAIHFLREQQGAPWCLHLSFVKPHWPYVAPSPYHAMFRGGPLKPTMKNEDELKDAHPVVSAFRELEECRNFASDHIADHVKPAYMGLVAQLDHHLGRVLDVLDELGETEQTLIVLCADHGDLLGDHWLGEKELFYEAAIRIPLIVVDPRQEADATRGSSQTALVEAIDVLPTILDSLNLPLDAHRLEGRSLLPLLRGEQPAWRDAVFCEEDYGYRDVRRALGREPGECRGWMVRTERWKYVDWEGYRPQLYDLVNDPNEMLDLGGRLGDAHYGAVASAMKERLLQWSLERRNRVTASDAEVALRTEAWKAHGICIGIW